MMQAIALLQAIEGANDPDAEGMLYKARVHALARQLVAYLGTDTAVKLGEDIATICAQQIDEFNQRY